MHCAEQIRAQEEVEEGQGPRQDGAIMPCKAVRRERAVSWAFCCLAGSASPPHGQPRCWVNKAQSTENRSVHAIAARFGSGRGRPTRTVEISQIRTLLIRQRLPRKHARGCEVNLCPPAGLCAGVSQLLRPRLHCGRPLAFIHAPGFISKRPSSLQRLLLRKGKPPRQAHGLPPST